MLSSTVTSIQLGIEQWQTVIAIVQILSGGTKYMLPHFLHQEPAAYLHHENVCLRLASKHRMYWLDSDMRLAKTTGAKIMLRLLA